MTDEEQVAASYLQNPSGEARVETLQIEAFDYTEIVGRAVVWIETEMIRTGRRLWRWEVTHLEENNYLLTFKTRQQEPTRSTRRNLP